MGAARSTRQQNNFTLVSKRLIQQFQSTHIWLTGLPTPQSKKLMHALSLNKANITIAIEFLSRSILLSFN
ncbi:unnamed protein product [Rotaria socialis]|uniref:Uncharacterized protein n=1 Tax=Rotaria socialis TaxID=392032 RepID=A0A819A7G0_9BILA|nr:unnamed protein product [Rotaria socialis]